MQKLSIIQATPGMVLAKAIMSDKGMPLCADGTELTEMLIERLKSMNILVITVKGRPVDTGVPDKTPEEKVGDMQARFARVKDDPLMGRIRDAIADAIYAEAREMQEREAEEKEEAGG